MASAGPDSLTHFGRVHVLTRLQLRVFNLYEVNTVLIWKDSLITKGERPDE